MIIVRQLNQKLHGNCPCSLFISAINLPLASKDIGDLLLGQVMVYPQIFNSLKLHHIHLLTNAIIWWYYSLQNATIR